MCTPIPGARPTNSTSPVSYDDVVADAVTSTVRQAQRAVELGVPRESVLIDPGHDFGRTYHSLELTRSLGAMVETGWPVLVSLSNKDFVGEALDKPVNRRLIGTLAAASISAWLGRGCTRFTTLRRLDRLSTWCRRSRGLRHQRCAPSSHDAQSDHPTTLTYL